MRGLSAKVAAQSSTAVPVEEQVLGSAPYCNNTLQILLPRGKGKSTLNPVEAVELRPPDGRYRSGLKLLNLIKQYGQHFVTTF